MVRHVIIWKLKEEIEDREAVKLGIKTALEGLAGKIPGMLSIKVHTEFLPSSNGDAMLETVFEDEASLKGYSVHPDHVKAADTYVRPFTALRLCADFDVPKEQAL